MNYKEYIENILKIRPNIKQKGVYMERHHIVPKCMGGKNDKENLIKINSKKIIVVETGAIFDSIRKAQAYFGKPNGCDITDVLRGRKKSFNGFHFNYYNGEKNG